MSDVPVAGDDSAPPATNGDAKAPYNPTEEEIKALVQTSPALQNILKGNIAAKVDAAKAAAEADIVIRKSRA